MHITITAKLLDQVGLVLGLVSGLLLIPEIFNLLKIENLEKSLEEKFSRLESWAKFPLTYGPPSWKLKFAEEQREKIEPLTAIRTLIFSIAWIALLTIGVLLSSRPLVFIILGVLILVTFGNMANTRIRWPQIKTATLIAMFFAGLFLLIVITPVISLIRVVVLILRLIARKMYNLFHEHNVLRTILLILAIVLFITSNILQFIATLL